MSYHRIADQLGKGERIMSFHSWLQSLRSALTAGQRRRRGPRSGYPRARTHRPRLEILEARLTPSFCPLYSYPSEPGPGWGPQSPLWADVTSDGILDEI